MSPASPGARERLVDVADRLFYAEGIHPVGIDRVIAQAQVAKATLYAHFAGKDELVAAYLSRRSDAWVAAVETRAGGLLPGLPDIALAPFDVLAQRAADPSYRGCPFINAAAEFPGSGPVTTQVRAHRDRVRALFARLLELAVADPSLLDHLIVLYDGALSAAYLDRSVQAVVVAREVASGLLAS